MKLDKVFTLFFHELKKKNKRKGTETWNVKLLKFIAALKEHILKSFKKNFKMIFTVKCMNVYSED